MPNREQFHIQNVAVVFIGALSGPGDSSDLQGADAFYYAAATAAVGGPAGTLTIEESDDDSAWSVAPATSVKTDSNLLAAGKTTYVGYVGNKRYARPVITEDVSASGTVVAVGGDLNLGPVNNPIE